MLRNSYHQIFVCEVSSKRTANICHTTWEQEELFQKTLSNSILLGWPWFGIINGKLQLIGDWTSNANGYIWKHQDDGQ